MLSYQIENYKNGGKYLTAYDMHKLLTQIKKDGEHDWLGEVSTTSLCRSCSDLAFAYDMFFKKINGYPKFKSKKKSRPSFPCRGDVGRFYFLENEVKIEKLGKIKYKTNYEIPLGNKQKFTNPRIKLTANGKWLLMVGWECENQTPELTEKPMGIDLGVKQLAVISFNDECLKFGNINKSKKMRQLNSKLKHLQRNLARKYKQNGSYKETSNIRKEIEKIRKVYFRIANIRKNYLHQTTYMLVSLLPQKVVMEDLNVLGMMKNRHLARAIQEQCFYEFRRQMTYKCEEKNIEIIFADRFFPSSKTCSRCGSYKGDLKLSDRTFVCKECGNMIDRDYNAAINLMRYKI